MGHWRLELCCDGGTQEEGKLAKDVVQVFTISGMIRDKSILKVFY